MLTGAPPFGERVKLTALTARKFPADWRVAPLPEHLPADLRALAMGLLRPENSERKPATARDACAAIAPPADLDATRTQLAEVATKLYQLAHQRRTAGEPGSCVGVRLTALHLSDRRSGDSHAQPAPPKRALSHRYVRRMLGIALLAVFTVGGLLLGLHWRTAELEPTRPAPVAAQGEESSQTAETDSPEPAPLVAAEQTKRAARAVDTTARRRDTQHKQAKCQLRNPTTSHHQSVRSTGHVRDHVRPTLIHPNESV